MISAPKVPYVMRKNKSSEVTMRGINYTNIIQDGDIYDSDGVVADEFPYISVKPDNKLIASGASNAIYFGGKLCYIKDSTFYYDGEPIGYISEGEKQMAIVNTKLVIFPDKKYFDLPTKAIYDLGSTVMFSGATFSGNKLTVTDIPGTRIDGFGGTFKGNEFTVEKVKTWQHKAFIKNETITPIGDKLVSASGTTNAVGLIVIYDNIDNLSTGQQVYVSLKNSGDLTLNCSFIATIGSTVNMAVGTNILIVTDIKLPEGSYYIEMWDTAPLEITIESTDLTDVTVKLGVEVATTRMVNVYPQESVIRVPNINTPYSNENVFDVTITTYGWTDPLSNVISPGQKISFKGSEWNIESNFTVSTVGDNYLTVNEMFVGEVISKSAAMYIYAYSNPMLRGIAANLSQHFKVGDTVFVTGSRKNNISFTIVEIDGNSFIAKSEIFTDEERSVITVERRIPDLDFICESNNRIYGCSNKDRTVHASALGDPTNFFTLNETSDDSFVVPIGSEGEFTACTRYGSDVLFWKEEKLHKLIGSFPAEYALYSYDIEGVQKGSEKSLCIVNEALYYKGVRGIYRYAGDVPSLISDNFGNKAYTEAVGGSDGNKYYISMFDGDKAYTYSYLIKYGIWMLEDKLRYTHFARRGRELYGTEGGNLYLMRGGEVSEDAMWAVQFCPMYETMQGRKTYSRLLLRVSIPEKSYMGVEIRTDGGKWLSCGHIVGQNERVVPIKIPINKCDKFEFRVFGKGNCKVLGIIREFFVGGES